MKSKVIPIAYTPTGLELSDGSQLDADVIVFCTGFEGNMRTTAASIVGDDIADRLEDFFGVDEEGEIRGAWKPMNCKLSNTSHWSICLMINVSIFRSGYMVYWRCHWTCQILLEVCGIADQGRRCKHTFAAVPQNACVDWDPNVFCKI